MPATSKRVTKAMLEDLAVKQHKNLVERDKFLKKLIKDLHAERGLLVYCDLHGHSRK